MSKDKKQSGAEVPVTPGNGEITPKPPDSVAKLVWLRRYGWKHRSVVACAFLVVLAGWLVSTAWALGGLQSITNTLVNWKIERTVKDLRLQYPKARDSLSHGSGDFSDVDKDIKVILELDPRNGHGLYYAGEVKRIKNQSLFTPKSCVIVERLASIPQPLDSYENDFNRYLDIEKSLPDNQRGGNYSAETCYHRISGYCPERTAWVHHLLANDLYAEAMLTINTGVRADKLRRALEHAEAAADLYKDDRNQPGFGQCMPTTVLISEAKEALASLKR